MPRLTQTGKVTLGEVLPPTWMNAIKVITARLPVDRSLKEDEEKALLLLDEKWIVEMVWAAYCHNPVVNVHSKPFNTPIFQSFKASGKSYAKQLDLTVGVWEKSPQHQKFDSPMHWWIEQMLDCKKSDYRCALESRDKPIKKKAQIKSERSQIKILRVMLDNKKDKYELADEFCRSIPSMGLLLRKAINLAKLYEKTKKINKKAISFRKNYWTPYLNSVQEQIEYFDRGGHTSTLRLVQNLEGTVYVTAPRRPIPIINRSN